MSLVRLVSSVVTPEQAAKVLEEGGKWQGEGLNTSKASRKLFEACVVVLVSADFKHYKEAFSFSLALTWGIEIHTLDLTEKGSEAAFNLSSAYTDFVDFSSPWNNSAAGSAQGQGEGDDNEEGPERVTLAWDEVEEELPTELAYIYEEVRAGRRKLDLKVFLEGVPRYRGLPTRPLDNNYRMAGKTQGDRNYKDWQSKLLHIKRAVTLLYSNLSKQNQLDQKNINLLQQTFQLLVELNVKIEDYRKEISLPGSSSTQDNGLFGKEELQTLAMSSRINGKGVQKHGKGPSGPHYSFRSYSNFAGGFRKFQRF